MADRYFINGGVDNNWGSTSNWSNTDGGTGGASVPTASDDVYLTSLSPSCNLNTPARNCLSLNCTGYTNDLDFNAQLTVATSNIVLSPTMTLSGASALVISGSTGTAFSNGKIITVPLTMSGNITITLGDDWHCSELVTLGSGINTSTINGYRIVCSSSLTFGGSTANTTGTTEIIMNGSGTLTMPSGIGARRGDLTFDTSGTIDVVSASGNFNFNTGVLKYVSGTINVAGITLNCSQFGGTLAVQGILWESVTLSGSVTWILDEKIITSALTVGQGSTSATINGDSIDCYGNVQHAATSGNILGTSEIHLLDTLTVDGPSLTTGDINNKIVINPGPGKTVTFDSRISVDIGQVQYLSGTVITDAGTWASGSNSQSFTFGT